MFTKLYEHGLVVIPVKPNSKAPVPDAAGYNAWATEGIPRAQVELFEEKYPLERGFGVGVVCGRASNICVLDIDTDAYDVLHVCPPSPVVRRGKKGEARFFQFNPDLTNVSFTRGEERVDVLIDRKYIIIPPSVHPETKRPYAWLTPYDLTNFDVSDLPVLTPEQLDQVAQVMGSGDGVSLSGAPVELKGVYESPDGIRAPHGSYHRIKALAQGLISELTPIETAVKKLLAYDEKHHKPIGYFTDGRRASDFGADPFSNALRLYANLLKTTNENRKKRGLPPQVPDDGKPVEINVVELKTKKQDLTFSAYPAPRGIMATFSEICELTGKGRQDALALGGGLVLMAGLCSNRYRSEVRGLQVWPNLFVLNLGYSSFGKDVAQRLIDDILCDSGLIGSANYRSGGSMVQDLPKQQERVDLIDECSWLLKAMHMGEYYQNEMVEILSLLFSRSSTRFNGIASVKHGSRHGAAYNPCVNILGSTTPAGFRESVNRTMASKGLMPRFLTFFQKEIGEYKGAINVGRVRELTDVLKQDVEKILGIEKDVFSDFYKKNYLAKNRDKDNNDLDMGHKYNPQLVPFSADAMAKWLAYEKKNHYLSAKAPDEFESPFYGRFAELSAKVALIDAVSIGRTSIEADSLDWAIELVERCWSNSKPLYELSSAENKTEADHVRFLNVIKEAGGVIAAGKLSRKTQWLNSSQRGAILDSLMESEQIQKVVKRSSKGGGPRKTHYALKGMILETDKSINI